MNFTFESLQPYLITKGSERYCFRHPEKDNYLIKLRPENAAKQTEREIKYFQHLKKIRVPFSHIPDFGKVIHLSGYVGFEQEIIRDFDGNLSKQLFFYLDDKNRQTLKQNLIDILEELKLYIYKNRILVCDLGGTNIVIQRTTPSQARAVIVDGLGNTDFIPICNYIPFLASLKAHRRWRRFMQRFIPPHISKK